MYDLIVYEKTVEEVEDFIEDYFRNPQQIFDNISGTRNDYGDLIITIDDFETSEDLRNALNSERFYVDTY